MKLIFCPSQHYSSPEIRPKQDSGHDEEKATSMAWIVQNMKPSCLWKKNKKNKMKKKKKKKQNQQPKKIANSKGLITLEERLPISSPTVEKDEQSSARGSHQVESEEESQMYAVLPLQAERLSPVVEEDSDKNISAYVSLSRHDSGEYSGVSLEELLNSSDYNTSIDTESVVSYYSDSRDFINTISLEKLLKDARLEVEENEIMYSFPRSQSVREKKKVRFRLPEASDIIILSSPPQAHQVVVDSKE